MNTNGSAKSERSKADEIRRRIIKLIARSASLEFARAVLGDEDSLFDFSQDRFPSTADELISISLGSPVAFREAVREAQQMQEDRGASRSAARGGPTPQ